MGILDETLALVLSNAALFNPIAICAGFFAGFFSETGVKCLIAGFAITIITVVIESLARFAGFAGLVFYDGGVLAVFLPRMISASLCAYGVLRTRRIIKGWREGNADGEQDK